MLNNYLLTIFAGAIGSAITVYACAICVATFSTVVSDNCFELKCCFHKFLFFDNLIKQK